MDGRSAQKRCAEIRSHRKNYEQGGITSFRDKALPGHNAQTPDPAWERNCYSRARVSIAEICGARLVKTDIDWF
jgi:hypothetical protein